MTTDPYHTRMKARAYELRKQIHHYNTDMPALTEEQWEASACLKKSKDQFGSNIHHRLCVSCYKRVDDPSVIEPCRARPILRVPP